MGSVVRFFGSLLARLYEAMFGSDESELPLLWEVTPSGELLFDSIDCTPMFPVPLAEFGPKIEQTEAKFPDMTFAGLLVERHIATGWWQDGSLTLPMLEAGTETDTGIALQLQICGQMRAVTIVSATYYADYDILMVGADGQIRRARDMPDALCELGAESAVCS